MYQPEGSFNRPPHLESKPTPSQLQAMARYAWVESLKKWKDRGGALRLIIATLILIAGRAGAIVFWENIFATLVSAIAFGWAGINCSHYPIWVTVVLHVIGVFFQAPLLFFMGCQIRDIFFLSSNLTAQEFDEEGFTDEEIMEDIHKPFSFGSIAILIIIPLVVCLISR